MLWFAIQVIEMALMCALLSIVTIHYPILCFVLLLVLREGIQVLDTVILPGQISWDSAVAFS
jgi:hypothetical protein